MTIETTVNISKNNRTQLENSADYLKISKNELIKRLIVRYLNQNFDNFAGSTRIKYQKRLKGEKWKPVHIWLSPEFYDKCQDLRRFHKLSISYILTKAIELYLNEILQGEHNNYFHNYMFIGFIYNNCPVFIITWDYPGNNFTTELLNLYDNNT